MTITSAYVRARVGHTVSVERVDGDPVEGLLVAFDRRAEVLLVAPPDEGDSVEVALEAVTAVWVRS